MTRTIAQYELREPLGEGGFGQVFAAWDTRLQRPVALKFLRGSCGEGAGESLLREARLGAAVRHPALVAVHDVLIEDGSAVIVMERVFGQTLKARLGQRLSLGEALSLLQQAAECLSSLHGHGLAHGDLKPSNLMLQADGRLRVLDFGLATPIDATESLGLATPGEVLGTPAFMAPERLRGMPPSAASDIYALGLIGLALLDADEQTPTQPLAASERNAGGEAAVRAELSALLRHMTHRSTVQRLPSMVIAASDLARMAARLREGDTSGRPAALPARRGRLAPGLAVSGALALVLVAGGAAILATRDSAADSPPPLPALAPEQALAAAESLLANFEREGAIGEAIAHLERPAGSERLRAPVAALLAIAYCLRFANDERDPLWLQRAESAATLALQADDQFALAHAAHAWVLEYHGEQEAAEQAYLRALALDPGDFHALAGRVRQLTAQSRFAEADTLLAEALQRHPLQRQLWDALGTLRFRQADYAAAEAAFRRSIAIQPDSVYAYANLNAALLRQDRGDEALAVLQQGLRIRPHGRLYSNLGTALFARGRYAEAVAAFESALSDARGSPNDYLKWANLADALRQVPERQAEAQAAYARALQLLTPLLRPGSADAQRFSRAALYAARLGQRELAGQHLAEAERSAPGDADFWFRALLVAEALDQRDTALGYLDAALAAGYPRHLIETEPELLGLRRDARYHLILSRSNP